MQRDFLTALDDLTRTETREHESAPLAEGQVLLEIERFALTANNVTYAVVGEAMHYWDFFPAPEGWGRVPVWGYARVAESRHAEIAEGERLYGYLPISTHLVVEPGKISDGLFRDMTAQRQPMSPVYNQYRRLAADPAHEPERETTRMLFEPLFLTSFLIEDTLRRAEWHRASTLIVTSASSKTALGLAHVVRAASPDVKRIGLTGRDNIAFVESTGLYDQVIGYDSLDRLIISGPSAVVDFAGNSRLLQNLYDRVGAALVHVLRVGVTHHEARGEEDVVLVGVKPVWFFAPDAATALIGEIGQDGFQQAVAARWGDFVGAAEGWVTVEEGAGPEAIDRVWQAQVAGTARADMGYVLRP